MEIMVFLVLHHLLYMVSTHINESLIRYTGSPWGKRMSYKDDVVMTSQ